MAIKGVSNYQPKDWIVLVLGAVILGIQIYEYAAGRIEGSPVEIGVFCIGLLLLLAPASLVTIIEGFAATIKKIFPNQN